MMLHPNQSCDRLRTKQALRSAMSAKRRDLGGAEEILLSREAQENLLADDLWQAARIQALYSPIRRETGTAYLIRKALDEGKEILLPRTMPGSDGLMRFLPYAGRELLPGPFGILEPAGPFPEPEDEIIPGIILVPGLAFDCKGFRLGSGGGYYDRFFARAEMKDVLRIGFAYSFQIVECIPELMPWDIPLHGICTEEGCIWF